MAKKKRKGNHKLKAPLSAADKLIYFCITVLGIAVAFFGFVYFGIKLPNDIAYREGTVIACLNNGAMLGALPVTLFNILISVISADRGIKSRRPIFGNKSFKPKFGQPNIKTYPLFSKEFRDDLSPQKKAFVRRLCLELAAVFLVTLCIMVHGLFSRVTLDSGNMIKKYGVFNNTVAERQVSDANRLVLEITRFTPRRGRPVYGIRIGFDYGDIIYEFSLADFDHMEREETLMCMVHLKSLFSDGEYVLVNADCVDLLKHNEDYTDREAALADILFDIEQENGASKD